MNTPTRSVAALGFGALTIVGLVVGGTVAASATAPATTVSAASPASVTATDDLTDTLTFMREEERLARDLYAAIAEYYDGATPFSKITNSEDHHYDAVGTLLDTYDIDDPSEGLDAGTYADAGLQELYDDLLASAQTSLDAAYEVGVTVEVTDIADLEAALEADYPADVDRVLSKLLSGSEKHLTAFTAAADGTAVAHSGNSGNSEAGHGRDQGASGRGHADPSRATTERQGRAH